MWMMLITGSALDNPAGLPLACPLAEGRASPGMAW
jgi:hypothetical protein